MQPSGLKFLLPYMRPYYGDLGWGVLYALLSAGAGAISPTVLGWAVDELTNGIDQLSLALYSFILIILALILAFFRYQLRMLTGHMAAGITYRMNQDVFERLLLFDQETRQQFGTGDLLSRATNDFIHIWKFYSASFQMAMHAFILLALGCALMALTSPMLATLIVVMLVISIIVQVKVRRFVHNAFVEVQEVMGDISEFTREHLNTAKMLTAYAQEDAAVQAFRELNQKYIRKNLKFVMLAGAISPLPAFMVRMAATLVIGVGGLFIINEQLTVGVYVQFIVYLTLLNTAAMYLTGAFERTQQGSAAGERIQDILARWPKIVDEPDAIDVPLRGDVRFEGVGVKAEDDHLWILRDINIYIPAGQTLGIVGPTGSGKSMLLSLLGRIRDPEEGRVCLDGHDLRHLKLDTLRKNVVYVPQETLLFGMPLRDNIALGLNNILDEQVKGAVKQARLSNDLPQLPKGLDTIVGERGATLSGGQKQRTAIARALVREPKVLLLDDALASVDTKTSAQIMHELSQGERACTRLIVSQRLAAVREADHIIVLDQGRIAEEGNHQSLLARDGIYASMHRRETTQLDEAKVQKPDRLMIEMPIKSIPSPRKMIPVQKEKVIA